MIDIEFINNIKKVNVQKISHMHTTPEKLHKNSKEELNARTLDIKKTDWSTFLKKFQTVLSNIPQKKGKYSPWTKTYQNFTINLKNYLRQRTNYQ